MGEYHVELPDGRIQRVRYRVDKYSGFVADVTYEDSKDETPPKYEPIPLTVPRKLPAHYQIGHGFNL